MHRDRAGDARQRAVERFEPVAPRLVGMLLHPWLVDLHHIGAGREQVLDFGIHRIRIGERDRFFVLVVIVLDLPAHGERTWDCRLDGAIGIGAQHFEVAQLHRAACAGSGRPRAAPEWLCHCG